MTENVKNKNDQIKELSKTLHGLLLSILHITTINIAYSLT